MNIKEWQTYIYAWSVRKGWWPELEEGEKLNINDRMHRAVAAEKLLLIHSEVTEALEEMRSFKPFHETYFDASGKPQGFPSELADTVIRILNLAEACGINLNKEIELKMTYNEKREHRHGNRAL